MIFDRFSLSDMASLIIAFSVLMGVLLAYLVVMRILRQQAAAQHTLRSIEGREFYSKDEAWRTSLERKIADLSERLTDRADEFYNVNHLIVDAEKISEKLPKRGAVITSPFLDAMNVPVQQIEDDLIFVLTPFEKQEEATFAAIVEAFQNWDVRVLRGDEENIASNILQHIVRLIARANVIIANIATRNPNVMYELGIAQALGKKVIIVAKTMDDVPFDLAHQRILLYKTRDDLVSKLRESVGGILLSKTQSEL